ncbi:MAG: hypothetical protein ABFS86_17505 [Planctomycetota bacterium]
MEFSFQTFMSQLIDYAGLFPPAQLDMATAVKNWLEFEQSDEDFMLHSFVVPAWRVDELAPRLRGRRERFPLTVIIRPGANLAADIGNAMDIGSRIDAVEVVGVEGKLAGIDPAQAADVSARLRDRGVTGHYWFETGFPAGWEADLPGFVESLPVLAGLKVRCGGLVPEAFPSVEEVAGAIHACATKNRPLKATAGLHHPVRHHDGKIDTMAHGFLNVFGALVMAEVHRLPVERICEIVGEEDPECFCFRGDTFSWRDLRVEAGDLGYLTSFGSCSLDEPRDDLRALGLL